ncbi:MAG TPA: acyl-CoA dehydrogenase [Spirochaetota bacterium]|nr:acyl-CoA dehydrogenase [Spirochaetota bacterium]HPC42725.1 acyl-CoA dehydrogenase [Spirochaetota bacterium]HPL16390.1 acyl-CoA dehydrogenase [Spirochaetota bacterium]HQF08349.1 acyl-CoA dehydrogenase [Spirochaetota bacterium]HQH98986.1 acyl-CoA dehydrogenase [Spirochaetota bacterium]
MALNPLVDSRDMRFVLFEMLEVDRLSRYDAFSLFDRDTYESTLDLAEKMAVERVYPANAAADKIGARYDPATKNVTVPTEFKTAMAYFNEAGFTGLANDPEWGGTGMPEVMYRAVMEYFFAASISFTMNVSLLVGATNLVKNFASEELKKLYLGKMISGEWGGTMCLTEPDAGSDVGALKTKAVKQKDGTYLITGQKIFISAGENDLYENIIHPVLARIEGDPAGTKGISIFLVPKFFANPDGTPGKRNDVVCSGIEHKMGIKGSPTCTLSFGDNGACVGYLMGEERQGMKIMFQMMNEARLDVALQGLGAAGSAYLHAVAYARSRVQGADAAKKGGGPVTIVKHPDVRRMLLWMKSHVEAMRMITLLAAYSADLCHADPGAARESQALLDFLIPLCKAGNTDLAWLVTAEAIQVYGGYGFCADYPVEQLARDSKILSIYEGTNGIQSIDLAMRKLLMNPDMYNYGIFKKRIHETIDRARGSVDAALALEVERGLDMMDDVIRRLAEYRDAGKTAHILAVATPLQQAFRMLAHAWMHLWSLSISLPKLKEMAGDAEGARLCNLVRENPEAAFYYGKVLSSRFYLGTEFRKYFGCLDSILSNDGTVVEAIEEIFTGAMEG